MQKRLVRKLDLELFLSQIRPHPKPSLRLEQYTVSVEVAARMLYIAGYVNNDIVGNRVLDLGCGTGRLALGAAFLGASQVVGLDIDKNAVKTAYDNSLRAELKDKTMWIAGDINAIHGTFETVLQNPPFGVQRYGADRKFLKKALESAKTVYSLHKHPTTDKSLIKRLKGNRGEPVGILPSAFLQRFIQENGGRIVAVYALLMVIPHMFNFHSKKRHEFIVDLYVIKKASEDQ